MFLLSDTGNFYIQYSHSIYSHQCGSEYSLYVVVVGAGRVYEVR